MVELLQCVAPITQVHGIIASFTNWCGSFHAAIGWFRRWRLWRRVRPDLFGYHSPASSCWNRY